MYRMRGFDDVTDAQDRPGGTDRWVQQ